MLRIVLTRLVLLALPSALYLLWMLLARRSGRPTGAAPWGWLVGAGAVLIGLSLMATAVLRPDNRGEGYVPAEAHPGGGVTPAGFDPHRRPAPVGAPEPNTAP